jgi:hypothetical protein
MTDGDGRKCLVWLFLRVVYVDEVHVTAKQTKDDMDDVLRRKLSTPPEPHKPKPAPKKRAKKKPA